MPFRRDPAPPSWLKRDRPPASAKPLSAQPREPAKDASSRHESPVSPGVKAPTPAEPTRPAEPVRTAERPSTLDQSRSDGSRSHSSPPGNPREGGREGDALPEPPRPRIDDMMQRLSEKLREHEPASRDRASTQPPESSAEARPAAQTTAPAEPPKASRPANDALTRATPEPQDEPKRALDETTKIENASQPDVNRATGKLAKPTLEPTPEAKPRAAEPSSPHSKSEPAPRPISRPSVSDPARPAPPSNPTAFAPPKPAPEAKSTPEPTSEPTPEIRPRATEAPSPQSKSAQASRLAPRPTVRDEAQRPPQTKPAAFVPPKPASDAKPVPRPKVHAQEAEQPSPPSPRLVAENPGLEVRSLGKQFKKRPVLRDVSLSVQRGEAVGLLGPNGAGKTTCFYIVTGLIAPDYGQIVLDSSDITGLPMYRRARLGIGYLPQEASIFRGLTVEQNIMAVLELIEKDREKRHESLEALMAEFAISHLRRTPAVALSGGERRRLEIARALASQPHFILLDEPLAGIDPIAVRDIRELVSHLKDRGIGVLITDHNVRETLDIVDRAYILHDGSVLMEGTPDAIVGDQEVRRVYLGDRFQL